MKIEKGKKVKVHYTGTLEDGKVFDTSEGKDPLEYISGVGMMIKGFDDNLSGMSAGEEKEFTIQAADAYGEYQDDLMQEVPKEALKGEFTPEAGQQLMLKGVDGRQMIATIKEVNDSTMKLDLNHPLAGKALNFKVKIEEVNEMSAEEKEQLDNMMKQAEQAHEHHHHSHEGHDCASCGHSCGPECDDEMSDDEAQDTEEHSEEDTEEDADEVKDALAGSEEKEQKKEK